MNLRDKRNDMENEEAIRIMKSYIRTIEKGKGKSSVKWIQNIIDKDAAAFRMAISSLKQKCLTGIRQQES